jgi:hypothetical protein
MTAWFSYGNFLPLGSQATQLSLKGYGRLRIPMETHTIFGLLPDRKPLIDQYENLRDLLRR